MKVEWDAPVGSGRKIEGGIASWADQSEDVALAGGSRAVRAYYNVDGKYRRGSPEASIRDLALMVINAAKHDEFLTLPIKEIVAMIAALTNELDRRLAAGRDTADGASSE